MLLLAISGSLRSGASNTALLEAVKRLAPPDVTVELYDNLASLPAFNPDLDSEDDRSLPAEVAHLRALIDRADGVLISTPEYAHGLPGAFKNALDWLVGSVEFPGTPIALIFPTAQSTYAQAQLREVLRTMSARIVEEASRIVPLGSRAMGAEQIVSDAELSSMLRSTLEVFVQRVRSGSQTVSHNS
jgi:chromate reductase